MILLYYLCSEDPGAESDKLKNNVLYEVCGVPHPLMAIKKTSYGKPYLENVAFSVSHSGECVCIALVNDDNISVENTGIITLDVKALPDSIGVDIEAVYNKSYSKCKSLAERKFFKEEVAKLSLCKTESEYIDTFCAMWTQKESYCKYTGVGLVDALSFDTQSKRDECSFNTQILTLDGKKYALSVCYNAKKE